MNNNAIILTTTTDADNDGDAGYNIYMINASSDMTVTLTASVYDGLSYEIIRLDSTSSVVTIAANTGTTIGGGASITLSTNGYYKIINMSNDWKVVRIAYT